MSKIRVISAAAVAFVCIPFGASATDHGHSLSITNSPLHLVSPGMVEMTGEYAINRKLGAALIGGYGQATLERGDEDTNDVVEDDVTIYEAGAQVRYYLVGSFDHGMQVGAEAFYMRIDGFSDGDVSGEASGFGVGPFIGYKKTARFGLTFDMQVGYQYFAAQATARDEDGNSSDGSATDSGLLLNLNLGWAF